MLSLISVINIVLIYLSISIALVPFRLLGVFNPAIFDSIFYLLIGSIFVYKILFFSGFRASWLMWFVMLYPIFLVPLGLFNEHSFKYVFSDTVKPIIFFSIIFYIKNIEIDFTELCEKSLTAQNILFVSSAFSILVVMSLYFSGFPVRPSVSDLSMYFTLSVFLFSKKKIKSLLFCFLIFVGGKLGPLLGFLLSYSFYKLTAGFVFGKLLFTSIVFVVFVIVALLPLSFFELYVPFYSKISFLFSADFAFDDLLIIDDKLLGGRLAEIYSSLVPFYSNKHMIFTGFGVGYEYEYFRGGVSEGLIHGVHFSPVSILTIYGAFYTVIFYLYILFVIIRCFEIFKRSSSVVSLSSALFFMTAFFNSFTSFSIFSVILFPICAGLILNKGSLKCVE